MSTQPQSRWKRRPWIILICMAIAVQVAASVGCPPASPDQEPNQPAATGDSSDEDVTSENASDDEAPAANDQDPGTPDEQPGAEAGEDNTNADSTEIPLSSPRGDAESEPSGAEENSEPPLSKAPGSGEEASSVDPEELFVDWGDPELALFVSGRQHGYIEPCGCTGLANQKGGLLRRHSCLKDLKENRGWAVVPIDLGNQVRRFGAQASIKFTRSVESLSRVMEYKAIGLGPDDLRLPSTELIQAIVNSSDSDHVFASANVKLFDDFIPVIQVVESKGHKLGVTSILGPKAMAKVQNDDAEVIEVQPALEAALAQMNDAGCELKVLMAFGTVEETKSMVKSMSGFDLIVSAGGDGEPTMAPEMVEAGDQRVPMVQVGSKGMYVGVVGWFPGTDEPLRYQRVPLDDRYEDSDAMKTVFKQYQEQLKTLGLEGLEVRPISHPSGATYVGSETCADCHTTAYDIWENGVDGNGGPHFHATDSLVNPGERTWVQRHFDPECLSCHVTGWNPQRYFPYDGGYLDLEKSAALHGNGCENCHGPGSRHVAAENGDIDVTEEELLALQKSMHVALEATQCMECHDLDNSPDFHVEGAFEKYWARIVHEGTD